MNDKKLKLLRIITGILFAYLVISNIESALNYSYWGSWFAVAGYLCMAISMFSGCYTLLTIGAVGNAIPLCVRLLQGVRYVTALNILYYALGILSCILLMCAVGKKQAARKLCIVAAIAALSSTVATWILSHYTPGVQAIFVQLVRVTPIVLSGQVLNNVPVKKSSPATAAQSPVSKVEALSKLKSLLDAGAISQEEFDAKKTRLLEIQAVKKAE